MSNREVASELEKLRAEVAELKAQRQAAREAEKVSATPSTTAATAADSQATPPPEAVAEPGAESVSQASAANAPVDANISDKEKLTDKLEELYHLIEQDFKDMPTMPALAVFTAGILIGRFLK